jgi:hypothetical protein
MIDSFFGALTFEPLKFLRMDSKEQFEVLRRFVPDLDFEEIEGLNRADYAARRELNAEIAKQRAIVSRMTIPGAEELPSEPIDLDAIAQELASAGEHNGQIEVRQARREQAAAAAQAKLELAQTARGEAAELRRQADEREVIADRFDAEAADLTQRLTAAEPLPEPIDAHVIMARMIAARGTNGKIEALRQRRAAEAEIDRQEGEAKALTVRMDQRTQEARDKIAKAALPFQGLALTPDGVILLDGLPFNQASDADQLRASVGLAMAANPKLRVILVREGSLLDDDSMKLLTEIATERQYQIWIERVGRDNPIAFEMSEGRLREQPEGAQQ